MEESIIEDNSEDSKKNNEFSSFLKICKDQIEKGNENEEKNESFSKDANVENKNNDNENQNEEDEEKHVKFNNLNNDLNELKNQDLESNTKNNKSDLEESENKEYEIDETSTNKSLKSANNINVENENQKENGNNNKNRNENEIENDNVKKNDLDKEENKGDENDDNNENKDLSRNVDKNNVESDFDNDSISNEVGSKQKKNKIIFDDSDSDDEEFEEFQKKKQSENSDKDDDDDSKDETTPKKKKKTLFDDSDDEEEKNDKSKNLEDSDEEKNEKDKNEKNFLLPDISSSEGEEEEEELKTKHNEDFVYDFDLMMQKKKEQNSNRKRKNIDLINDSDDIIADLLQQMKQAVEEDFELNRDRKAATHKMKLLPLIQTQLRKIDLREAFLDSGVLNVITDWLTPLPDRSLPNLQVRETMLKILLDFNIVDVERLKSSGIGKAVMYLFKNPKETKENKKKAAKLISNWSRPIFSCETDYQVISKEDREQRDFDHMNKVNKRLKNEESTSTVRTSEPNINLKPGDKGWIPRARVPAPSTKDYVVRPKSTVDIEMTRGSSKKPISRLEKHLRNFQEKKRSLNVQRAVKISIEGRKI